MTTTTVTTMPFVSIRQVLCVPENNQGSWFCLPQDKNAWTLETLGVFSLDSVDFAPDSDEYLPREVKEDGWIEALSQSDIEEVVDNAKAQAPNATPEMLLEAFIFYVKNDAFIEF